MLIFKVGSTIPFIFFCVGWILSGYFFGAYGDDGKGKNGNSSALFAAAKSWAVGIPVSFLFYDQNLSSSFSLISDNICYSSCCICLVNLADLKCTTFKQFFLEMFFLIR
jgi:hypothetical protein